MLKKLQRYLIKRIEVQQQVTLKNNRIYILPTRQGLLFALTVFVMLMAAINFSNSLIYLFTFFLASLAILSMFTTQKNLLDLSFHTTTAVPVYCGETAYIPLHIYDKNNQISQTGHKQHYAITIITENFSQTIDPIDNSEPINIPIKTYRRGYIQLPVITISSLFPFGLFYAWSNIKLKTLSIAYPKPVPYNLPNNLAAMHSNNEGKNSQGNSDFHGLDKYSLGESLKQVHWKAYAKGQGLYIKRYAGSDNSNFYWLDWLKFEQFEIEKRLSILSHLITQAEKKGDHFGLRLPHISLAISEGKKHKHQCLEQLALF